MNNFEFLSEKIEKLQSKISFARILKAADELSMSYRMQTDGKKPSSAFMAKEDHKLAYLSLRMPATFAAIAEVLKKIQRPIDSLLDVGSGPGTVFFAANSLFPGLKKAVLIEKDAEMIRLGNELLKDVHPNVRYQTADIKSLKNQESFDLVTAAYTLSELSENDLAECLIKLWEAANSFFCIVEPGTPYGFKTIVQARKILIEHGAFIVAPCTHENRCPMQDGKDWCHFSTRLERTRMQRRVKNAELGYEDEKYSYLIVSKIPMKRDYSRIVKTPIKRSGFLSLKLCNEKGLEEKIFSKKNGEAYQLAKKLDWGDSCED